MPLRSKLIFLTLLSNLFSPVITAGDVKTSSTVKPASNLKWGALNPLRGDKSPRAANIWGDRTLNEPTGMLVKFEEGFSSPPHIHNILYRGVVIEGLMHNDTPESSEMWMPTSSFWTQPAGANHITAAASKKNLIYLEIDSGPYLVKPSHDKFENGEKPINLHRSNLVWLSDESLAPVNFQGAELATLWGRISHGVLGGSLLKLPAGFDGNITIDTDEFKAIVISGRVIYKSLELAQPMPLMPGSYFSSTEKFTHKLTSEEEAIIYIRSNGVYEVSPSVRP
ncbi:DUF4437 domain-containing protein [Alteromonadaceae bacterium M269]|nr:DUF4437 domain-containing protein [Alteromonadaceae bacterium M269]